MRLFGVLIATLLISPPASPNDIADYCRSRPQEVANGLQSWVTNGMVKGIKTLRIEVEERRWEAATHDQKVSIAVFAYCNAIRGQNSDSGTVIVRGYHDGQQKASVVDGNYSD